MHSQSNGDKSEAVVMSESMGYLLSAASNPTERAALEQMSLEIREERESHTRKQSKKNRNESVTNEKTPKK